jgi:hypothetical protein
MTAFIILRIIFSKADEKLSKYAGIAVTAVGILCLILMCIWKSYDRYDIFGYNFLPEDIFIFIVPILYCAAFTGRKYKILFALSPPVIYFLFYFTYNFIMNNFFRSENYFFDRSAKMYYTDLAAVSTASLIWALVCILVCRGIYIAGKFIKSRKNKNI